MSSRVSLERTGTYRSSPTHNDPVVTGLRVLPAPSLRFQLREDMPTQHQMNWGRIVSARRDVNPSETHAHTHTQALLTLTCTSWIGHCAHRTQCRLYNRHVTRSAAVWGLKSGSQINEKTGPVRLLLPLRQSPLLLFILILFPAGRVGVSPGRKEGL